MPLYRLKGQPEDHTFLLEDPEDPRYELVEPPKSAAKKSDEADPEPEIKES